MAASSPPNETSRLGSLAVFLVLAALVLIAFMPRFKGVSSPLEGQPAPDANLSVVLNGAVGSNMKISRFQGRAVVLDFWATWCGPCTIQAPILDRIAKRYEKQGLVVVGVNIDDPPAVAKSYAQKHNLSYPIVSDTKREASTKYGVEKLPSLVVIDRTGRVVKYMTGVVDEASLDEVVAATL